VCRFQASRQGQAQQLPRRAAALCTQPRAHWNDDPQPFVRTKSIDDIITKVKRGSAALDHVIESATHH
jgi:hypothetical protein